MRAAVRLIIEETLEADVTEAVGRGYYDRADGSERGHRNGSRMGKLDSAEGRIEYAVPQVRGLEGWRSEVRASLGGKSEELERLAIEVIIPRSAASFLFNLRMWQQSDERNRTVLINCAYPLIRTMVLRAAPRFPKMKVGFRYRKNFA